MIFGQPVSYTQLKISVTYLIFTAELTHGLACSDSICIVLIFLLLVHTAIKDLDLYLDLVVAGLDTSLSYPIPTHTHTYVIAYLAGICKKTYTHTLYSIKTKYKARQIPQNGKTDINEQLKFLHISAIFFNEKKRSERRKHCALAVVR